VTQPPGRFENAEDFAFRLIWVSSAAGRCDESRKGTEPARSILGQPCASSFDRETDMNLFEATDHLAHDTEPADTEPVASGPLSMIAHPQLALDAARRMELNCRSGLRFYSDFRRVRSLDELPEGDDGDDGFELFEDPARAVVPAFDPAFSRRY
jgi:hypothetical protein